MIDSMDGRAEQKDRTHSTRHGPANLMPYMARVTLPFSNYSKEVSSMGHDKGEIVRKGGKILSEEEVCRHGEPKTKCVSCEWIERIESRKKDSR